MQSLFDRSGKGKDEFHKKDIRALLNIGEKWPKRGDAFQPSGLNQSDG